MANSTGPVQSIDRVLDIIETLSEHPQGLTLKTLSEYVDLHISTTHRLLTAIIVRGYVQKDETTGKYRLTTRFYEIGSRIVHQVGLVTVARPLINKLSQEIDETIHLVMRDDTEVMYLYKEESRNRILSMGSFIGSRRPLYCTATGKSILANLKQEEIDAIWEKSDIRPITPYTILRKDDLMKELEEIRVLGYAIDHEENELGVNCVAVAILNSDNYPAGAISVSGPAGRIQGVALKQYADMLKEVAAHIKQQLSG